MRLGDNAGAPSLAIFRILSRLQGDAIFEKEIHMSEQNSSTVLDGDSSVQDTMTHAEAHRIAEDIVRQMTLDEKISQLNYTAPAIERLGIPEYNYWNEALHGVARAGVATVFPQAIGMAAMFDRESMERVGEVIAEEGRAKYNAFAAHKDRDIYKGLTFWSPNVNIFRDPRWGRGQETYGEDPYLTGQLAVSFIKGIQGEGKGRYLKAAACAKHFAVHSGPEACRHEFDAKVSQKDLVETYLPAFKDCAEQGDVEAFMAAYNSVNGQPAAVNTELMQQFLYGKWHFQGHVVSDFMALEDVHENHKYTHDAAETMALSLKNGVDLCAGRIPDDATRIAIERGILSEEDVTRAVIALFASRVRLGLFADDCPYDQIPISANDTKEHRALSRAIARKSFVLLKNDGLLPLKEHEISSIAVVGPNADNVKAILGNYFGTPSHKTTVIQGIERRFENDSNVRVTYALGCGLFKDHAESGLARANEREVEAIIAAEQADVIVAVLGLDPTIEGEQGDAGNSLGAGDKDSLSLPAPQKRLLEKLLSVGKPVVLLLSSGSALSLDGFEKHENLAAIMQIWYAGGCTGDAVADVLFGDYSPSGKLPITFYHGVEELPAFTDYSMQGRTYRYMQQHALYPFGYGLTYGDIRVDEASASVLSNIDGSRNVQITVQATNHGSVATDDVIQIYVHDDKSDYAVRNAQLKGFKRVHLSPNESVHLCFTLDASCFTVVTDEGDVVQGGDSFSVWAGTSQPDPRSAELLGFSPVHMTVNF